MKQMKNPNETNGYVMLYTMQDKRSLDVLKKKKDSSTNWNTQVNTWEISTNFSEKNTRISSNKQKKSSPNQTM